MVNSSPLISLVEQWYVSLFVCAHHIKFHFLVASNGYYSIVSDINICFDINYESHEGKPILLDAHSARGAKIKC